MDRAWGCTGKHLKVRREWKGGIPAWDSKDQVEAEGMGSLVLRAPGDESTAQPDKESSWGTAEARWLKG